MVKVSTFWLVAVVFVTVGFLVENAGGYEETTMTSWQTGAFILLTWIGAGISGLTGTRWYMRPASAGILFGLLLGSLGMLGRIFLSPNEFGQITPDMGSLIGCCAIGMYFAKISDGFCWKRVIVYIPGVLIACIVGFLAWQLVFSIDLFNIKNIWYSMFALSYIVIEFVVFLSRRACTALKRKYAKVTAHET